MLPIYQFKEYIYRIFEFLTVIHKNKTTSFDTSDYPTYLKLTFFGNKEARGEIYDKNLSNRNGFLDYITEVAY